MGDVNVGEFEEDELIGVEMDGIANVCCIRLRGEGARLLINGDLSSSSPGPRTFKTDYLQCFYSINWCTFDLNLLTTFFKSAT